MAVFPVTARCSGVYRIPVVPTSDQRGHPRPRSVSIRPSTCPHPLLTAAPSIPPTIACAGISRHALGIRPSPAAAPAPSTRRRDGPPDSHPNEQLNVSPALEVRHGQACVRLSATYEPCSLPQGGHDLHQAINSPGHRRGTLFVRLNVQEPECSPPAAPALSSGCRSLTPL